MTRRLWLLCWLLFGLLLLGLVTVNGALIALSLPLATYLVAALLFGPGELRLSATRSIETEAISETTPLVVKVEISNQGDELETVFLEDHLPPGFELMEGENSLLTSLLPGGAAVLNYTMRVQRGRFRLDGLHAIAEDQLGLYQRHARLIAPAFLLATPDFRKLRAVPISPLRTHGYNGPIPARLGGAGVNFFGLREYQLGDPWRWINWRASARHIQSIIINEFERERIADIGLILDARQHLNIHRPDGSLFEYSIEATASLAEFFLSEGHHVGLLIYGRGQEATFPGYGKMQRERILRALAGATTGDNMALSNLSNLPTRFFPARSQIVLVSPLSHDDLSVLVRLRAAGYQLLVVSADPVTFEAQTMKRQHFPDLAVRIARIERVLMLRKLQRAGIQVVDWQVHRPLDQVMHEILGRAPRSFRVLGVEP